MAECRDCGQKIEFIELASGKFMPVDPEIIEAGECELGDIFMTLRGTRISITEAYFDSTERGQVSHFSTCRKKNQAKKL